MFMNEDFLDPWDEEPDQSAQTQNRHQLIDNSMSPPLFKEMEDAKYQSTPGSKMKDAHSRDRQRTSNGRDTLVGEKESEEEMERAMRVFAHYLGVDLDTEIDLLPTAREAFYDLPQHWEIGIGEGEYAGIPYFYNAETNQSYWKHPHEAWCFERVKSERARKRSERFQNVGSSGGGNRSTDDDGQDGGVQRPQRNRQQIAYDATVESFEDFEDFEESAAALPQNQQARSTPTVQSGELKSAQPGPANTEMFMTSEDFLDPWDEEPDQSEQQQHREQHVDNSTSTSLIKEMEAAEYQPLPGSKQRKDAHLFGGQQTGNGRDTHARESTSEHTEENLQLPCDSTSGLGEEIWNAVKTENMIKLLDLLRRAKDEDLRFVAKDDYGNMTALALASWIGYTEMVTMLLKAGADANQEASEHGWTALICASWQGHLEIVRVLLEFGVDVNLQNKGGDTALMSAADKGRLLTMRVLLECGSNVNLQNMDGWTALMYAARRGLPVTVRVLLEFGAEVNLQNKKGVTALIMAAGRGHLEIVRVLREFGAEVNVQSKDGVTALMCAAKGGHLETVQVLLEWGADKKLRSQDGNKTAADMARTEEIKTLISTHEEAGANDPVLPSPAEVAAAECAELEGECDTLGEQVTQAPARRDAMQRRDALQAQLDAAKGNYEQISTLGESLEAVKLEIAQLRLSEEDYLTLAARHAALVQRVEAKCEELLENNSPDLLGSLADKLTVLQGLHIEDFPTTPDTTAALPGPPVPHDPTKLQRLLQECDTVKRQVVLAPARHEFLRVGQELQAVRATKPVNYKRASELLKLQNELRPQVQLSEEDYLTLAVRHAALVQQVQGMCEDLVAARQYRLLRDLAAQLTALKELDVSYLPTTASASTAGASGDSDDGENDPVWVENP